LPRASTAATGSPSTACTRCGCPRSGATASASACSAAPCVTVNYLSECFTHNVEETAIVLNTARIAFGLSVAFYITPWVTAIGVGWAYGLMAFIMIVSWLFVMALM
jgi:hypothetical protein